MRYNNDPVGAPVTAPLAVSTKMWCMKRCITILIPMGRSLRPPTHKTGHRNLGGGHNVCNALATGLNGAGSTRDDPGQGAVGCSESDSRGMATQEAHIDPSSAIQKQCTHERTKGRALTKTLVYRLARDTACTAHPECKGGPSFKSHWSLKAYGCAIHVPCPRARCMQTPSA